MNKLLLSLVWLKSNTALPRVLLQNCYICVSFYCVRSFSEWFTTSVTAGWRAVWFWVSSCTEGVFLFCVRACLRVYHMLFFHVNWKHMHLCCITFVFTSPGSSVAAICECISNSVRAPGLRGLFCYALALFSCGCSVFLVCGFALTLPRQTLLSLRDESRLSPSLFSFSDFAV